MAPEALLPSEIARLVYGYLIEERCTEIAKSFLNESPNLYECRMILQCGKTFTIHPFGLTLLNILDTFCTINCIVQDHLAVYDKTNKLKNKDIVTQLKFLLRECCKSQQVVSSSNESAQNEHAAASGVLSKIHKKRHSGKNENGLNVAVQSDDGYQTETPPDSNSLQNIPSVEATPLENLPGYVQGLQTKPCETWPPAIKSPTKILNKFTQSQQIKENVRSQVVQTSEPQKICQATQIERTVQSQEVQTSVSPEMPIEERDESEKKVNELNTERVVTGVGDELSNCYNPKTDLCNNLGSGHIAEEVINLDDSGEHTSLESQKSANSIVIIDENASSSEEVEMDIDNKSSASEKNQDVITGDNEQCDPKPINVDGTNVSPIIKNSQAAKISEITNQVIATDNSQIPPNNVPNSATNEKCLVNSIEPSLFDKDFPNPSEFPDHITSTPLKLFAAVQNYDNNEWFSAQNLPSSGIVPQAGLNGDFPYAQTAIESIVSPVDGFISPIICKENTKIAEKISLNCLVSNARKEDDTLNTPEVPPMTKSFIPSLPAPVPATVVPPKDKTPELPKSLYVENVQTVQSTSPKFISISSLVKNTEFNRFFSIDSIDVKNIDNNSNTTAQTPSAVSEVENPIGTGLTPLLQMQKKAEERHVESQKSENSETGEVMSNGITGNEKVDEINAKADDVVMEDMSDEKLEKTDSETNNVEDMELTPTIGEGASEIMTQTVVNEVEKNSEIVSTEKIVNDIDMNEDVVGETDDINSQENADLNSKAVASDEINGEPEKVVEETLEDVQVETIEKNDCIQEKSEDATSKVHNKMDVSIESTKHDEPKAPATSGKKESLKSILSKKFESYIDTVKDNTASNHNNETTRNTPKPLVEERAKRRSLSTPKKPSSHIRALTFETPIQSRSDSKIKDLVRPTSPETAKRNLKRVHESFQSPPVGDYEFDNQLQSTEVSTSANTVNEKENSDDQNVGNTAEKLSQNKETKEENAKKSWDSDLRVLVGPPSEQPKVEAPKRKYKMKSKEGSSTKKKKRDKSKTPRKEKKSEKTPHKKSKKSEKEKSPKKSHKRDKSKENRDDKKNDSKDAKSKAVDKLSAKDFKDLGAQIENNLLFNEEDNVVNNVEIKKKTDDKLSAKECKDISAQIENNLLSNKLDDQVVNKIENKKKVDDKLSAKECKDISAKVESNLIPSKNIKGTEKVEVKSKVEEKLSAKNSSAKIVNNLIRHKHIKPNLNVARNKQASIDKKSTKDEVKEVHEKGGMRKSKEETVKDQIQSNVVPSITNATDIPEKMVTKVEDNVMPKEPSKSATETTQQTSTTKSTSKKDPLEYLLSDSITDDDVLNDIMQMESDDLTHHEELSRGPTQVDREIAEKMQQDEEAIAAVLEEANQAVNEKYKNVEEEKPEDFFPETSLMTDGDESQEEGELVDDSVEVKKKLIASEERAKGEKADKTLDNSSKSALDYDSIEQQLSIITDAEPTRKVMYDHVSKVEDGKVVKKKYARLKTLDTKLAVKKSTPLCTRYEVELDTASDSMEMPPTPQIADPGSNSWVPNPILVREDSQRTVHCSVPTPLECPPTPKIFITPRKEGTVDTVPQKVETVPYYHLTAITFETAKKPEVTEFEVVKEVLKKSTPKTPVEKEDGEGKMKKTSGSARSKSRDKSASRSRMDDSEDSDSSSSSSSSDSSDSSSSSSDEDNSSSKHATEVANAKEVPTGTKRKVELLVQNEEVVIGNEVMLIEHEEVIVARESSPAKVFPIEKTDKELAETIKETPAKDENMIPEEGIFETPNVSKPVDNPTNLHAKISQMMILREQEEIRKLESQQKPKIINVENVAPKIVVKIPEKSEAEVVKAIMSIADEKFEKNLEDMNSSAGSNKTPEVLKDKVKKRELSKAIQSITEKDDEDDSSDSSSDSNSSSDDEPNLQLVLEDDVKAGEMTDESLGFDNSEQQHAEFHVVFDEANFKKRRRKQFTDDEMMCEPHDEDGRLLAKITPSCVDILLNIHPKKVEAKKKVGSKKKGEAKEEEEEFDDGDSSEDFVPTKNTRGGAKRRRSNDEPKSRKRKKNMFIY